MSGIILARRRPLTDSHRARRPLSFALDISAATARIGADVHEIITQLQQVETIQP